MHVGEVSFGYNSCNYGVLVGISIADLILKRHIGLLIVYLVIIMTPTLLNCFYEHSSLSS